MAVTVESALATIEMQDIYQSEPPRADVPSARDFQVRSWDCMPLINVDRRDQKANTRLKND